MVQGNLNNINYDNIFKTIEAQYRITRNMIQQQENIIKGLERFNKDSEKFMLLMAEAKYPPHYGALYYQEIRKLLKLKGNITTDSELNEFFKDLDVWMVERHDQDALLKIYDKWKNIKWLDDRISILSSVIDGHNNKMYNLTVPTIVFQIEGVIAHAFNIKGTMNGPRLKKYLKKFLINNNGGNEEIYHYYVKIVLGNFEHGQPIDSVLNRNAIAHGGDVKYGTGENSLRAIFLFDLIIESLDKYKKNYQI